MKDARCESVRFVPCVLKLDKHKFASYVERHVGLVAPLGLAVDVVKIFSKRKKARRAAIAMARLSRKAQVR